VAAIAGRAEFFRRCLARPTLIEGPRWKASPARCVRDCSQLSVHSKSAPASHKLGVPLAALSDRLSTLAARLPVDAWTSFGLIPGSELGALRTGRRDLAGVEPFRLVAEGLGDKIQDRARLTIFVTGTHLADGELLILASDAHAPAPSSQVAVDDLIDLACSVRSRAPGLH